MISKLASNLIILVFSVSFGLIAPAVQAVDDLALQIQQAINSDDFEQAQALLDQSEDLPEVQKTYLQGWLSLQQGNETSALESWQQLHKSQPDFLELGNNLAVLLLKRGEYEQAQAVLEQTLHADIRVSKALENLRQLYGYQAQKAYKKVFKKLEVEQPTGHYLSLTDATAIAVQSSEFAEQQAVLSALENWRLAWSNQAVKKYLASYADSFVPANSQPLSAWKAARARSLSGPKYIEVLLSNLEFRPLDDKTVSIKFVQRYKSDRYNDQVVKVMLFEKFGADWKITQEVTVDEVK